MAARGRADPSVAMAWLLVLTRFAFAARSGDGRFPTDRSPIGGRFICKQRVNDQYMYEKNQKMFSVVFLPMLYQVKDPYQGKARQGRRLALPYP